MFPKAPPVCGIDKGILVKQMAVPSYPSGAVTYPFCPLLVSYSIYLLYLINFVTAPLVPTYDIISLRVIMTLSLQQ